MGCLAVSPGGGCQSSFLTMVIPGPGWYVSVHLYDENSIPLNGAFHGFDELDNQRFDLDFCWVSLNELKNGLKIYPLDLIPIILNGSKEISHFIYKDL